MNETFYLVVFTDETVYEMKSAVSLRDAIWEVSKYKDGDLGNLFYKCLEKFTDEDTNGIIDLYNHFSYNTIDKIYTVDKVIYDYKNVKKK